MNSKLLYISWKSVLSQIVRYHFCVVCVHTWMNRRHCSRECRNRLAPKWCPPPPPPPPPICIMLRLAEWQNELNVSNEMHCICFLQRAKSQTPTHAHKMFVDIWYTIFDMCGMINFVRDVILICKNRINTQIPIVLFKHHMSNFGASRFFTLSQTMPPVHPSEQHIPHKNGTKWFGIKHSFMRCIIIYCS